MRDADLFARDVIGDLASGESPLSFTAACRESCVRRDGKVPHVSLIYRLANSGRNGVRLETLDVNGVKSTTRSALLRYFARVNRPSAY